MRKDNLTQKQISVETGISVNRIRQITKNPKKYIR
jgi:hypothetical protein